MSVVGVTKPEHPVVMDVILPLFLFTVVTSGLIGFAEPGNRLMLAGDTGDLSSVAMGADQVAPELADAKPY